MLIQRNIDYLFLNIVLIKHGLRFLFSKMLISFPLNYVNVWNTARINGIRSASCQMNYNLKPVHIHVYNLQVFLRHFDYNDQLYGEKTQITYISFP